MSQDTLLVLVRLSSSYVDIKITRNIASTHRYHLLYLTAPTAPPSNSTPNSMSWSVKTSTTVSSPTREQTLHTPKPGRGCEALRWKGLQGEIYWGSSGGNVCVFMMLKARASTTPTIKAGEQKHAAGATVTIHQSTEGFVASARAS